MMSSILVAALILLTALTYPLIAAMGSFLYFLSDVLPFSYKSNKAMSSLVMFILLHIVLLWCKVTAFIWVIKIDN